MSNKKYRLLKDLPYVKAGVVYVKADGFNGVHDRCSYVPDKMGMMHERFALHLDWVESNPDWFEEVVEPERVEVRQLWYECAATNNHREYCFQVSASIPPDKFPAIKQAIEMAINGDAFYSLEDVKKALHGEWGTANAVGGVLHRLEVYKKSLNK